MDMLSPLIGWIFLVFLQLCPLDHMAKGQVYTYYLEGQLRQLTVTVTAYDAKAKTATLAAEVSPTVFDGETRTHYAEVSWANGTRKVLVLRNEGNDLLEGGPLLFPSSGLVLSSDTATLFTRAKAPEPAAKPVRVEGVKSGVKPTVVRYTREKDAILAATAPDLGVVDLTLNQWGETQRARLTKVKR